MGVAEDREEPALADLIEAIRAGDASAFAEAYANLGKLRDPAAFPGWFRRIVFKQADRLTRRPALRMQTHPEVDVPASSRDPEESAASTQALERVHAALAGLPEHERVVASLFYLAERSYAEISDFLVLPLSTIKKRLHDARIRLKRPLEEVAKAHFTTTATPRQTSSKETRMEIQRVTPLLNYRNVERAIDFYRDALGFECTQKWEDDGRIRWARIENGAANFMLNEHGEDTDTRVRRESFRDTVIYLTVADADALHSRLVGQGYTTSEPFDAEYGLREFHMRDLEGYELAIVSPSP